MSDLGSWIEKLLMGRANGTHGPRWREKLRAIEEMAGSGRKAAKAAGIAESTWRGWRKGKSKNPKPSGMEAIQRTYRALAAKRIENGDISMDVAYSTRRNRRHGTQQTLTAANLKFEDGAAERIRHAYVIGGPEVAASVFLTEVKDPFYRKWIMPYPLRTTYATIAKQAGGGAGGAGGADGADGAGGAGGANLAVDYDFEEYDLDPDYGGNILS